MISVFDRLGVGFQQHVQNARSRVALSRAAFSADFRIQQGHLFHGNASFNVQRIISFRVCSADFFWEEVNGATDKGRIQTHVAAAVQRHAGLYQTGLDGTGRSIIQNLDECRQNLKGSLPLHRTAAARDATSNAATQTLVVFHGDANGRLGRRIFLKKRRVLFVAADLGQIGNHLHVSAPQTRQVQRRITVTGRLVQGVRVGPYQGLDGRQRRSGPAARVERTVAGRVGHGTDLGALKSRKARDGPLVQPSAFGKNLQRRVAGIVGGDNPLRMRLGQSFHVFKGRPPKARVVEGRISNLVPHGLFLQCVVIHFVVVVSTHTRMGLGQKLQDVHKGPGTARQVDGRFSSVRFLQDRIGILFQQSLDNAQFRLVGPADAVQGRIAIVIFL